MSYRFVKVSTFYPSYLENFRERNRNLPAVSYEETLGRLLRDSFSCADFYAFELGKMGVDAQEIVSNFSEAQNIWAQKNGLELTGPALVMAQLKQIKPEVVFVTSPYGFSGEWLKELRENVPSIRLILGWCSTTFSESQAKDFRAYDSMFCCTPGYVSTFRSMGMRAELLNHAFSPMVFDRLKSTPISEFPDFDFGFFGALFSERDYHLGRIEMVERLLAEGVGLRIFSKLDSENPLRLKARQAAYQIYQWAHQAGFSSQLKGLPLFNKVSKWPSSPLGPIYSSQLKQAAQDPVFGLPMFAQLAKSKIVFNSHIDTVGDYAGNIRLYEVTGMGSCLLTDWKSNLKDLFAIDAEVVTYKSPDECIEKVKWLLSHPAERAAIAKAGQVRCLRDHTFEKRAVQLNDWIKANL